MRKSPRAVRIFMSLEKLADLRLDVATRRRNLLVNETIFGTRHGEELRARAAAALSGEARTALSRILATLANGERWTDATTRELRLALAPLRHGRFTTEAPESPVGLDWHISRLDELMAQHGVLRHLETMLAMATTEPTRGTRRRKGQRHRATGGRTVTARPPAA